MTQDKKYKTKNSDYKSGNAVKINAKTSWTQDESKENISDNYSKSIKFDGSKGKGTYTTSEKDGVVTTSYTNTKDGVTTREDTVNGKSVLFKQTKK